MQQQPFNPNEHIMQIKNKGGASDYLPVQWRIVWFRSECPNGTIDTEEVYVDLDREVEEEQYVWNNEKRKSEKVVKRAKGYARFKATITDGKGGRATGTKSETAASFPDYIEKSETGAIGRALAALGYGTAAAPELTEEHRIVDSPVDRGRAAVARPGEIRQLNTGGAQPTEDDAAATEQQLSSIHKLCERLSKPSPAGLDTLTYAGGRELISQLTQEYRARKAS